MRSVSEAADVRAEIRSLARKAGLDFLWRHDATMKLTARHIDAHIVFRVHAYKGERCRAVITTSDPKSFKVRTWKSKKGHNATFVTEIDNGAPRRIIKWLASTSDENAQILKRIIGGEVFDLGNIKYKGVPYISRIENLEVYSSGEIGNPDSAIEVTGVMNTCPYGCVGVTIDLNNDRILVDGKPFEAMNLDWILQAVRRKITEWSNKSGKETKK